MDYIEQLNRAIDHIEENLSDDIVIDSICKEAGISKWHFQRVFKAVMGETIKEYTLKRRLSVAATKLLSSEATILHISLECGFGSHEVFSRAFKRVYLVTPQEFRSTPNENFFSGKRKISIEYIENLHKGKLMDFKLIKLSAFVAKGVSGKINHVHSNYFSENLQVIPKLWAELNTHIGKNNFQKFSAIDESLDYFAGVIVNHENELPQLLRKDIPGGSYAEFLHRGPMSQIEHTMDYIYGTWFPQSGRKRREGPDLSMHTEKTNPASPENEIRILVPIQ